MIITSGETNDIELKNIDIEVKQNQNIKPVNIIIQSQKKVRIQYQEKIVQNYEKAII